MKREVVVTGIGAVSPLGIGAGTLYERWRDGSSGIENGEGAATEFLHGRAPAPCTVVHMLWITAAGPA